MAFSDSGGPVQSVLRSVNRALLFSGRSTRTELIYFMIVTFVVGRLLGLFVQVLLIGGDINPSFFNIVLLIQLVLFSPIFALVGRRLQDFGISALWSFFVMAPSVLAVIMQIMRIDLQSIHPIGELANGIISLLSLLLLAGALFWPGNPDTNQYGPNPRLEGDD